MRRLRTPDYLAGLGGLLLFFSLFAPWTQLADGKEDGWRSLLLVDVILMLIAFVAIALPIVTAVKDDPSLPIKWDVLTAWVSLIAIVIMVVKVLGGLEWGAFLALIAAVMAFAGSWWAMREQSAPGLRTPPEVRAMPTPPADDPTRPAS